MTARAMPADVAAAYARFPDAAREGALALRALIFAVAEETPEAGRIAEELRWGEPAYLTPETKSGSTIRIGVPKAGGSFALFVNCRTSLISDFRDIAPGFRFEGTRAVLFAEGEEPDSGALAQLIRAALTYHRR